MLDSERIAELEKENCALREQLRMKERNQSVFENWNTVKTWASSFGVRLLIVGGVVLFIVVLPAVLIG